MAEKTRGLMAGDRALLAACFGGFAATLMLWLGAVVSAWVRGAAPPAPSLGSVAGTLVRPGDPASAWGRAVGTPTLYWSSVGTLTVFLAGLALTGYIVMQRLSSNPMRSTRAVAGVASRAQVQRAAGARVLVRHATTLRPSLTKAAPASVGTKIGTAQGVPCWTSVEDSTVILGPPRSGKGLHLVIPMILDAPGSVITTSTRPDNLAVTIGARSARGPVGVFDPQGLAPGVSNQLRWSPMRGCRDPQTAMIRARTLAAGAASGTTESTFWQAAAEQAIRCLLHAAALSEATAEDLYRWSLSPVLAAEAVMVLSDDPRAAQGWANALDTILSADQRQRDSVWAMVGIAFNSLADPRVLAAVSPEPGSDFDPAAFLSASGAIYLLGTSSGAGATSNLIAALVEDVVETARRIAAGSQGARIDPPLSLILDEAANYRLPSLPSLMSEGGGSGISTTVVLQSLSQARSVWGNDAGVALWDAAIVKLILGGGSNARDLEDLSKLAGTREEPQITESVGADRRKSRSTSERSVPIFKPDQLRQLPFGTAVLLHRSAPPILLSMRAWLNRRDSARLRECQRCAEARIRQAHAAVPD